MSLFANQGALEWRRVSPGLQSWSLETSSIQPQSALIAVSAELRSPSLGLVSTGMQSSRCVYDVDARL